jgi:L-serine dehydratase
VYPFPARRDRMRRHAVSLVRRAVGAVKAWTAFCIASDEAETRHRVDLDTTIAAMAMTARDMNRKYKETSEAGLAALVLC